MITISLVSGLLSDLSLFYLFVSLWILSIIITYTGSCMYMISIGKSERKKREEIPLHSMTIEE